METNNHSVRCNNENVPYFVCVQVEARDAEIDRLSRMLDGGRPSDVVALESRNRANERMISHLNIQVSRDLTGTKSVVSEKMMSLV